MSILIVSAVTLKCYSCISSTTGTAAADVILPEIASEIAAIEVEQISTAAKCNDPFNSTGVLITECQRNYVCVKAIERGNNVVSSSRGCLRANRCSSKAGRAAEFCGECSTDLCNGAAQLAAMSIFVGLSTKMIIVSF